MIQWRRVNNAEGRMSEKLFLFFPQSCRCRDSIADESSLIKHRGHLPIITKDRAGIIERQYKNTIYSVTDDNGEASVRIVSSNYIKKIVINSLLVENEIIQGFSLPYILLFTICALIKHRHLFLKNNDKKDCSADMYNYILYSEVSIFLVSQGSMSWIIFRYNFYRYFVNYNDCTWF